MHNQTLIADYIHTHSAIAFYGPRYHHIVPAYYRNQNIINAPAYYRNQNNAPHPSSHNYLNFYLLAIQHQPHTQNTHLSSPQLIPRSNQYIPLPSSPHSPHPHLTPIPNLPNTLPTTTSQSDTRTSHPEPPEPPEHTESKFRVLDCSDSRPFAG